MDPQVLLVTGANTGLGYQIIRALCGSDESYIILLGGRSPKKASQAAEDAMKEFTKTSSLVTPVQIDIEDDESIEALYERVQADYGRLDILINNAGALSLPFFTD